ncbi:hypothetical protein B296_00032512 [Ensete ventricosum]|uniref:Uncharacterized protein n=1 Tax=Ensete ventricosum TaxID=4639 RepID=A0A426Y7X2_ENSVE|nr:hypothetical protein B296_00032512 [Ensete ventricosum]
MNRGIKHVFHFSSITPLILITVSEEKNLLSLQASLSDGGPAGKQEKKRLLDWKGASKVATKGGSCRWQRHQANCKGDDSEGKEKLMQVRTEQQRGINR